MFDQNKTSRLDDAETSMHSADTVDMSVESLDSTPQVPQHAPTSHTVAGNTPVDTMNTVRQNQVLQQFAEQPQRATSFQAQGLDLNQSKSQTSMKKMLQLYIILGSIAIVAGVATGFGGYKLQAKSGGQSAGGAQNANIQQLPGTSVKAGDVFGVNDSSTFTDSAQGYLEMGGIDGEGSHKLLRPGGVSQTVYLTSSITDLDPLAGMEVKVSGETFKGQKAGWLMDVGRVEVVNTKGEIPAGN